MTAIKACIMRHPVPTYFVLTFAISWGGVLVVIDGLAGGSGSSATGDPRFVYALLAMLAGPSLAGLLLTRLVAGKDGLRELRSRALSWRVPESLAGPRLGARDCCVACSSDVDLPDVSRTRFDFREPERGVRGGETEHISLLIRRERIYRMKRVPEIAEELRYQGALESRVWILGGRFSVVCYGSHDPLRYESRQQAFPPAVR